jgi:predicted small secreted protein
MKKICLFVLCSLFLVTIVGCGTIKGLGDDISTLGHWLTKGSDSVKNPNAAKPDTKK